MTTRRTRARFTLAALVAVILPGAATAETVAVYASAKIEPLARALVERFNQSTSRDQATLEVRQSAAGVHALTAGVATVAFVERPAWEAEQRPHRVVFGIEPLALRVALKRPTSGQMAPSVYVNAVNPMTRITRSDLARIYVMGNAAGDVGSWDQLGLAGRYEGRRIHLYGGRNDGGFVTNVRLALFGGRQFRSSYEAMPDDRAAMAAVRADPFGIAIVDTLPLAESVGVKRLTLSDDAAAEEADPFTPYVLAYVTPRTTDPGTRRFVRFVLSDQGQAVARKLTGFSALTAPVLTLERGQAERVGHGAQ